MIKVFAILFMFIDHLALILLPQGELYWALRLVGRLSMPLYAYCVARGCYFSVEKGTFQIYLRNILVLALVSQLPFALIWRAGVLENGLNICFSWFMSAFFVGSFLVKKNRVKYGKGMLLIAIIVWLLALLYQYSIGLNYGFMGVLMPIAMYICYERCFEGKFREPLPILMLVITALWVFYNYVECGGSQLPQLIMIFAVPLISFLSPYDKKVNVPKVVGYLCYPLSIIPFLLIRYILKF